MIDSSKFPIVAVLLATSNPKWEHISAQIESIREQDQVNIRIYWGDYKSDSKTLNHIRQLLAGFAYCEIHSKLAGPAANFFQLLRATSEEYISFSDQDDIWMPNKLSNHVKLLSAQPDLPQLVHSNSRILFGNVARDKKNLCNGHDINELLFQNCVQGCTMTINKRAREVVLESLPSKVLWHDWWIALVISVTGKIMFSNPADTIYRIHDGNTIGLPKGWKRVKNFVLQDSGRISNQFRDLLKVFPAELPTRIDNFKLLEKITSANPLKRLSGCIQDRRRRQNIIEDVARRMLWVLKQP